MNIHLIIALVILSKFVSYNSFDFNYNLKSRERKKYAFELTYSYSQSSTLIFLYTVSENYVSTPKMRNKFWYTMTLFISLLLIIYVLLLTSLLHIFDQFCALVYSFSTLLLLKSYRSWSFATARSKGKLIAITIESKKGLSIFFFYFYCSQGLLTLFLSFKDDSQK